MLRPLMWTFSGICNQEYNYNYKVSEPISELKKNKQTYNYITIRSQNRIVKLSLKYVEKSIYKLECDFVDGVRGSYM